MKITMIGMGAMGLALAQNMRDQGHQVIGYDASKKARENAKSKGFETIESLSTLSNYEKPRAAWVMVPSQHVDEALNSLHEVMESEDIIIEGGNSHFSDTERRFKQAADQGINYLGVGVSGGREGARRGPSMMAGGSEQGYQKVEQLLQSIAAKYEDTPCVKHLGVGGAGHFVKMVHNGIEYAIMQSLADAHTLLAATGKTDQEISTIFEEWKSDQIIGGYLTEITAAILSKKENGKPILDLILAQAKQKGTGRWAAQEAMEQGVATTTISQAVNARLLSGYKKLYEQEFEKVEISTEAIKAALQAAVLTSFAQGFDLLEQSSYQLKLSDVAKVWRAGCIIRSPLLQTISQHYSVSGQELLSHQYLNNQIKNSSEDLREVVGQAIKAKIPIPMLTNVVVYLDTRNTEKTSPKLIMAQRDYFGSHGYQRVDKEGTYMRNWQNGTEKPR